MLQFCSCNVKKNSLLLRSSSIASMRTRSRVFHCHGGFTSADPTEARPRRCSLQWLPFGWWSSVPDTFRRPLDWWSVHDHSCSFGLFTHQSATDTALLRERKGSARDQNSNEKPKTKENRTRDAIMSKTRTETHSVTSQSLRQPPRLPNGNHFNTFFA